LNLYFSPIIAANFGVETAFDIVAVVCALSMVLRVLLYLVDVRVGRTVKKNRETLSAYRTHLPDNGIGSLNAPAVTHSPPSRCLTKKDFKIGKRFWINLVYGTFMSASTLGFYYFSSGYLANKWWPELEEEEAYNDATQYNFLSTSLGAISVPICGMIADKYLIYNDLGIWSPVALVLAYLLFMMLPPLLPTIIYTLVTSTNYTAQWACMARCVSQKKMGIATGIIYSFYNVAGALAPMLCTVIQTTWGFDEVFLLLTLFTVVSLWAAVRYNFEDKAFRALGKGKEDQEEEEDTDSNEDPGSPAKKIMTEADENGRE